MDPATRAAAEDKLAKMNDKIGYPVKWRSYDFEVGKDHAQRLVHTRNLLSNDMAILHVRSCARRRTQT